MARQTTSYKHRFSDVQTAVVSNNRIDLLWHLFQIHADKNLMLELFSLCINETLPASLQFTSIQLSVDQVAIFVINLNLQFVFSLSINTYNIFNL